MSVQYRPDLGTIGLAPGYPPGNDREYLKDTANSQQTPSCYGTQKSHVDGQRQNLYGTKFEHQSSPISPLSPADSSQAVSENGPRMSGGWSSVSQSESSSHSDGSLDGHSNQEAEYWGLQYRSSEQLKVSGGYQNSPSSVSRPVPQAAANVQGYQMSNHQQVVRQVLGEQYAQSQSNYAQRNPEMAQMLQVLESALLDDDEENGHLSGSLGGGHDRASEGSWAETIEELLAAHSPAVDSSRITLASSELDYGKQYLDGNLTSYSGAVSARVRSSWFSRCL